MCVVLPEDVCEVSWRCGATHDTSPPSGRLLTFCARPNPDSHPSIISQVPQLTEVSWVYNTLKTVKFCEVATDFVDSIQVGFDTYPIIIPFPQCVTK